MKMKILTFGEIIWDIYPGASFIGGAPLNFCAHCVKCGAEGYMLSATGSDNLKNVTYKELSRLGIRTDFIEENNRPTGKCLVTLDEMHIPSFKVLEDTAYDMIRCNDEVIAKINAIGFDAFCFGTLAQRGAVSRAALSRILDSCRFGEIFCDINLRDGGYDKESVMNCLSYATILKLSEEEEPRLRAFHFWPGDNGMDENAKAIFNNYPRISRIIYTRGSKGAEIYIRDSGFFTVPAYGEKVVSTVGAGDSFGAVWLSLHLSGLSDRKAAEAAARVSGYVVSVTEAVPDYDIRKFIGKDQRRRVYGFSY
jgi:fructokinase